MTSREIVAASPHPLIAALFIACAIALGGGGSPNPATEVLLQLVFVALALAWLWLPSRRGPAPMPRSATFWLIGGLVLALPVIQLVPLPPGLWTGLAGQADRAAALALVGRDEAWQPLTHSVPRTLAVLLAVVPALFAFFAAASLDAKGRVWLAGAIAAMALAAALFGALQVSLGAGAAPNLYAQNSGTLTGFQANRNAAADVLLIGMAASAALILPSLARARAGGGFIANRRAAGLVLAGTIAVLFFAVLLTASRMGIALVPLVLAGVWLILLPALPERRLLRFAPAAAALAAVPLVALLAWRMGNTALVTIAERFVFADDGRRELWRDGWFAMTQAWPLGIGVGGAQPALIAAERLEVLDPYLPNRVHNDYLELALEGGLPALILLAAVVTLLLAAAWRTWLRRPEERHLTALGGIILLVVALHSFVDYPLRSMALACLAGTGAGLLISTPRNPEANEPSR